jgi:hypothetical protein
VENLHWIRFAQLTDEQRALMEPAWSYWPAPQPDFPEDMDPLEKELKGLLWSLDRYFTKHEGKPTGCHVQGRLWVALRELLEDLEHRPV